MDNLIAYVVCSVIVIPLLTKLLWSNKPLKKFLKKVWKRITNIFHRIKHRKHHDKVI